MPVQGFAGFDRYPVQHLSKPAVHQLDRLVPIGWVWLFAGLNRFSVKPFF